MKISTLHLQIVKFSSSIGVNKILPATLISLILLLGGVVNSLGQLLPGNIIVEQIGDGTTALSGIATKVKLLHFNTDGTVPGFASTAFFGFTGTPTSSPYNIVESGSATSNGYISLSSDKSFVVVPGYNAPNGQASIAGSAAATFGRTIGKVLPSGAIQANGTFNTLSGNNYRSIVSSGSGYWLSGGPGVVYSNTDITTGIATTATSISITNTRLLNIFNNTLCYSTGSGTLGIYYLGSFNSLPTSTTTATLIIGTGTSSPYGFAFSPNGLICYIADDRNVASGGGIQKWIYSGTFSETTGWSAGTWSLSYTLNPSTGTATTFGTRGITVDFSATNPIIYATTTEASINRLVKVNDAGAGSPATLLATATTNFVFRGIAFAPDNSWLGGGTTDWNTASNWSAGVVPTGTQNAIIPTGNTPYPVLSGSISVKDLYIQSGATVAIGANNTLSVNGKITGSGTLTGSSTSKLTIGGTAGTLNFTSGARSLADLTLTSGSATLGTALDIYGVLTVTAGTLDLASQAVTLKSTATSTARIAPILGVLTPAGATNVTVERYINSDVVGRKWHLLSGVSTVTTQNILQSWQENAAAVNNLGTWITSGVATLPGYDATSVNNSSLLSHNQATPAWVIPATTNTGSINDKQGYMLFVRGDRNATAANALTAPTVLRTTGALRQGTVNATVSSTGAGNTLVGNPYASPIDMEKILADGAGNPVTNLDQNFMVWDPALAGNFTVGGYRAVVRTGVNAYNQTPVVLGGTVNNDPTIQFIHSGSAFFLHATTADVSVAFTEAAKAATPTTVYNPIVATTTEGQQILANLMLVVPGASEALADGIRVIYNNGYSAATADDIIKMGNFNENLSSYRDGKKLIVERRPMIQKTDTIFLRMTNAGIRDYRFQIGALDFVQSDVTAFLEDTYKSSRTVLDLTGAINNIDFNITSDAASANQDRFRIVFAAAAAPQPQTTIALKAMQTTGAAVAVEWKATNQHDVKQYELERSNDGISYTKINTQAATGSNGSDAVYNWVDAKPVTGENFYRIRSIGINGDVTISREVSVVIAKLNPAITVYPNPVINNRVSLQFTGMEKGIYQVSLFSNAGQLVFTRAVNHTGGTATQTLVFDAGIAQGNYRLEIARPDATKTTQAILITK